MVSDRLPHEFDIDLTGMSKEKITYCLFLLHALGYTWKSGDKYEYTKHTVKRLSIGYIQTDSGKCFGWNPEVYPSSKQRLSLSAVENIFKKAVSKGKIQPFDYGQVMSYKERFLQGE